MACRVLGDTGGEQLCTPSDPQQPLPMGDALGKAGNVQECYMSLQSCHGDLDNHNPPVWCLSEQAHPQEGAWVRTCSQLPPRLCHGNKRYEDRAECEKDNNGGVGPAPDPSHLSPSDLVPLSVGPTAPVPPADQEPTTAPAEGAPSVHLEAPTCLAPSCAPSTGKRLPHHPTLRVGFARPDA